ncbi:MAG: hypothetical protein ACI86C_000181 [Candidatus Latescibacterota bacterium]|jgi:hypothetical protein
MVIMLTAEDTVTFERSNLDRIQMKYDASFTNDKYWLLAPFDLLWDEETTTTERENIIAPISKDTLNELTLTYGNEATTRLETPMIFTTEKILRLGNGHSEKGMIACHPC